MFREGTDRQITHRNIMNMDTSNISGLALNTSHHANASFHITERTGSSTDHASFTSWFPLHWFTTLIVMLTAAALAHRQLLFVLVAILRWIHPLFPGKKGLDVWKSIGEPAVQRTVPTSVNYHFTRQCNYKCGFCFHTAKTSFVLPLEEAKRGLKMLADAGMEKVNFSGGEPFLQEKGRYVGELVQYCKQQLRLPSVSIVSNGSRITEKWFQLYGADLDILAVSCDSFRSETNAVIGRQQGQRDHLASLANVRAWCSQYKVAFKLNTVVNTYNKDEDMREHITRLNPCRWKVFQCLLIAGENVGDAALRNGEKFVISDDDFRRFLERHQEVECLVPESNDAMRHSYLILDEYMRFLDGGSKKASRSLLDVGVDAAIDAANFDERMFLKRGGKYTWSKADMKLEW